MTFEEQFTAYLQQFDITYTQLAKKAGLNISTVARYKSGAREPAVDGEQIQKLAHGLCEAAREKGLSVSETEILTVLQDSVKNHLYIDYDTYLANLNALLKVLDIRGSTLAKALSYDPSHISKILSGQRRPGNIADFTTEVAAFAAARCSDPMDISALSKLLRCDEASLSGRAGIQSTVAAWLGTNVTRSSDDPVGHFLQQMDSFSLDEFISSIHFNDIRLPTVPFQLPTNKTYTGLDGMMKCELDFIKTTVTSRSMEDCILYSDMPIGEMANDKEFPKKWMFGMAMLLKKGLHLHIIHDVNRPLGEMMLGLESNIPMYMTGQISPWYLPASQSGVFLHLLKVSGAAAMEGSAIAGYHSEGKYTLTKAEDNIRFYRKKAERLLEKAEPLMDIYSVHRKYELIPELKKTWGHGERMTVACSLPLYTIPEDKLKLILSRSEADDDTAREILSFRREYLETVEQYLTFHRITLTIPELSQEEFEAQPINLALSQIFCETDIPYTYEEYTQHLQQTMVFAQGHPNIILKTDNAPVFRNIDYTVTGDNLVIVSKNKYPTIHFLIHHKKMVQAFRSFIPPVRE